MTRRITLIAALLWIVLAGWYWWVYVPLRADRVIEREPGRFFEGISPNGEVMFSREVELKLAGGLMARRGPVEFWKMPEGRKVREAFSANEMVCPLFHSEDGRTLVVRDNKLFLANLLTGEVVEELPGLSPTLLSASWIKGDRLVRQKDKSVVVYDLASKRIIATLADHVLSHFPSDHFVLLWSEVRQPNGVTSRQIKLIDLQAGAADSRFDALGAFEMIQLSPTERYAALTVGGKILLCDFASAKLLWSLPRTVPSYGMAFENGDEVFALYDTDGTRRLHVSRWRASDGSVQTPPADESIGGARRMPLGKTSYAVDFIQYPKATWQVYFDEILDIFRRSRGGRPGVISSRVEQAILVEPSTGRTVGLLATGPVEVVEARDGSGLVIANNSSDWSAGPLTYYSVPPSRDWPWFFRWGLLPPVIVILVVRWIRRRQDERRNGVACPLVGQAT